MDPKLSVIKGMYSMHLMLLTELYDLCNTDQGNVKFSLVPKLSLSM